MIVYSMLFITLFLAFTAIAVALRGRYGGIKQQWPRLLFALGLGLMINLYGAWFLLSLPAKYLFWSAVIVVIIRAIFKPKMPQGNKQFKKRTALFLSLALICIALCVLYFTGTRSTYNTVNLGFPLKHGKYMVQQGGKGLPTNIFHYTYRGAYFAMDIVKLNKAGNRAKAIFSKNLQDYEIYGDTVYAPCSGRVMTARSENPDNIPPNRMRGPSNTNQVLIATDSYYVFMAHLKQNCVFVREGDSVTKGQAIACAGNSGFSLEPHLHIQVHMRSNSGLPWYKEKPLYILFDGESYLLFETINAK